eukprot:3933121-Rhodomonas_salina.1
MQNFQNLFGFQAAPGMAQPAQQPQQQHQQQPQQNRPRKEAAVVPIMNPNATSKDLYCVEGAVMKEYDPIKKYVSHISVAVGHRLFSFDLTCAAQFCVVAHSLGVPCREWTNSTIKVQIERKPFAEGGMRSLNPLMMLLPCPNFPHREVQASC